MKKALFLLMVSFAMLDSVVAQYESHWPDFNYHDFLDYSSLVAAIKIDGVIVNVDDDNWNALEVAAFVGDQCRGRGNYLSDNVMEFGDMYPMFDGFLIYFNTPGEVVSFKMYDHLNGVEYDDCTILYLGNPTTIQTGEDHSEGWLYPANPIFLSFASPTANQFTVTLVPGSGSCAVTSLTEEAVGAGVILPAATPCEAAITAGWTFAGWAANAVTETTMAPELFNGTYAPEENITLYAVYQLGSFNYTFKNGDDYLAWFSGNSLTTVTEVSDNSLWDVTFDEAGLASISPVTQEEPRQIAYNSRSPRFATYKNTSIYNNDGYLNSNYGAITLFKDGVAVTSLAENDVVVLATEAKHKELSGFSTTYNVYGLGAEYTDVPAGLYPLTVGLNSTLVVYNTNPSCEELVVTQDPVFLNVPAEIITPTVTVEISCPTEGAVIYYTLDGTDPTAESTVYTAPFEISETTTVKAVAIVPGGEPSNVVSQTYTFPSYRMFENIAAFKAFAISSEISMITSDITFVHRGGRYVFVQDESAALMIYDNRNSVIPDTYNNGDVISGGIIGRHQYYNGMTEMIPTVTPAEGVPGPAVEPIVVTVAEVLDNYSDYESRLVTFETVHFTEDHTFTNNSSGTSTTFTQGEDTFTVYNRFNNLDITVAAGQEANVTGFIANYNGTKQIYPRDNEDIVITGDPGPETYAIIATANPSDGGTITGAGTYELDQVCTLTATANPNYIFVNWTENGNVVSTSPTYSFTVTGNATYVANFSLDLPELHVTGITHSALIGGQPATISWTVQNDGTATTPNGAVWHDRVWLSLENRVAADDNNPILLGTFDNLSALNPGEYYTQTQTFDLPIDAVGDYYLFVLTDAYDCYTIYWDSAGMQLPYSPPPYIGCLSSHCYSGCPNNADNRIYELSEYEHGETSGGYYNDNFFYELVDIEVPVLPDLQVTSIIAPDNFFSGSTVTVTATVSNEGEYYPLTDRWVDALFIATEPDYNSSSTVCIATVPHSGQLGVGRSYQVTFEGVVPLTMYGEAYFFVYTDCYEQVYEHVLNHNNITMSNAVNVILSPPGNLVPNNLTVSSTVSTGESFDYSFEVFNRGAGDPNVSSWVDKIYLCQNPDSLDANAVLLKTVNHYGGLHPGKYYQISESMVLPSSITTGSYYLYVVVDADKAVFEYLYDSDNLVRSNGINVICPDLQVTQITVSEQITGGYPLNLSYTLTNQGAGIVRNRTVTDGIFVSVAGNMTDTIRIASVKRNVYLPSGQSLQVMCNDLAPYSLTDGTYHLIVLADFDDAVKESDETNNALSHYPMNVFHQPLPDLQPVSLTLPAVVQAGETVTVEFDITNIGDLDLLNSNCTFDVYAAWDEQAILCPLQTQTLPLGNNVSIGIGQTVHFVRSILVPPTVTSACSMFELVANKGRLVPESDTTNNVFTASVAVLDCPLPDLVVANITAGEIQSGVENQISFTVNNIGTADFEGGFNATVYMRSATDTIRCPLVLQVSPIAGSFAIPVGGSMTFVQNLFIPPSVNASCNLLEVVVDEENQVLETNDDNNATIMVATVVNYPFDLKTTALQVSESVFAGETISLSWTVKNIGTCPSEAIPLYIKRNNHYIQVHGVMLSQPWVDKIYLSSDELFSDDDIELLSVARSTALQPNGTYTVNQSVTLPYTHIGNQYLLCISDATHVTYDSDTVNNMKVVPVEVQLGSLPDLRITSLIVEEEITSDRAYWVHYTVINEGERATQKDSWTDAVLIGQNATDAGAVSLGTKIHHGILEVGETYTDSIEILVPNNQEGNCYLMGYTDKTNLIYELDNENDNLLAVPVTVLAPAPCNLIAVQPEFSATVASGQEMTVSWQLRNIGMNEAVGRVRNAVYLSSDNEWSSDDVMLGYADMDINIPGNGQQACSLSGVLTGFDEGNHYVIVKVNILNALNESSYEDNVCVSMLTTDINYQILEIGETVGRRLMSGQCIYFKIQVGQEYEGQTLLCHLDSPDFAFTVANGIYLSHESVPTLSSFDFGDFAPFDHSLEIMVPSLEQGTYYLLVTGRAFQLVTNDFGRNIVFPQNVTISTSILNFEILSVDADHGANTGSVTTKVTGAKFDSIMDFRLVQGSKYLPAEKVFFSNSTETFTTFDLAEMPVGTYAMEAELPGGIITIKGDAFTIEEGLPAELVINIVAPSSVRSGNTFSVNIEYGNVGTTDLNVSGFVVVSRNGHPIGFTSEELLQGNTELIFYTAENNSNPDVLRPGYRGTKAVMVKATPSTDVSLAVFAIRRQY